MSNFSFTVYAPQRSGTNYLETLITSNFLDVGNCLITDDSYAWKHTTKKGCCTTWEPNSYVETSLWY